MRRRRERADRTHARRMFGLRLRPVSGLVSEENASRAAPSRAKHSG